MIDFLTGLGSVCLAFLGGYAIYRVFRPRRSKPPSIEDLLQTLRRLDNEGGDEPCEKKKP